MLLIRRFGDVLDLAEDTDVLHVPVLNGSGVAVGVWYQDSILDAIADYNSQAPAAVSIIKDGGLDRRSITVTSAAGKSAQQLLDWCEAVEEHRKRQRSGEVD